MKKLILFVAFVVATLCCNAQFVLTPSAGLMTEDGPYTIIRDGSDSENYYAAKKAVESAIPNADIGDLEYEKSFNATSVIKEHSKLPESLATHDWQWNYTLEVECADGKIRISFKHIGALEVWKKGEHLQNIYPSIGKNSMFSIDHFVFNSKGTVAKGCDKMKKIFEDCANNLVKSIENNLK